jgi:hypothetical protein
MGKSNLVTVSVNITLDETDGVKDIVESLLINMQNNAGTIIDYKFLNAAEGEHEAAFISEDGEEHTVKFKTLNDFLKGLAQIREGECGRDVIVALLDNSESANVSLGA